MHPRIQSSPLNEPIILTNPLTPDCCGLAGANAYQIIKHHVQPTKLLVLCDSLRTHWNIQRYYSSLPTRQSRRSSTLAVVVQTASTQAYRAVPSHIVSTGMYLPPYLQPSHRHCDPYWTQVGWIHDGDSNRCQRTLGLKQTLFWKGKPAFSLLAAAVPNIWHRRSPGPHHQAP